ncbi:MAG TPA: MBL fold metallo-hydrolase [Spirochaetia bacterium]|nr:MBL fold metallo-hydrolase [Spirochaetia bacterium]
MLIKSLSVGELQTNCYLVWDENTLDCLIIDPGDDADFITTEILQLKLKPLGILLTHGHYDHCLACLELKLNFNIPIHLNPKDNFLYQNASKSASFWSPSLRGGIPTRQSPTFTQPPTIPYQKEIILGDKTIQVISTPGHTPGSVCFYSAPHLFVGDTIFAEGVGRTDFSYSSSSDLKKSLAKIYTYPRETLIYPGHEESPIFLSDLHS